MQIVIFTGLCCDNKGLKKKFVVWDRNKFRFSGALNSMQILDHLTLKNNELDGCNKTQENLFKVKYLDM